MNLSTIVLTLSLTASLAAADSAGNLLVNGSFELGPVIGGGNIDIGKGSTAITGWTVTKGNVSYTEGDFQASDGTRSIDLDGSTFGGIAQTFETAPGSRYEVSFDLAANTACAPAVKKLRVAAAGASKAFSFSGAGHGPREMGWTRMTWSFEADSSTTTLEFTSLDTEGGLCGPTIDDVAAKLIATRFIRGDVDGDGAINISDPIRLLGFLFAGDSAPPCTRSADLDDGGSLTITDGIRVLRFLFLAGDRPSPPFPLCGVDGTPDGLTCESYPVCD